MRFFKGIFWIMLISLSLLGAHHLRWERTMMLSRALWRLPLALFSDDQMHARSLEIREHLAIPEEYEIEIRVSDALGFVGLGYVLAQVRKVGPDRYLIEMVLPHDSLLLHEMCHIALGHTEHRLGRPKWLSWLFWYTTFWEPEAIQCEVDYYKKYGVPTWRRRR